MRDLKNIINYTNSMKVLYVEDEDMVRENTALLLESLFLEVVTAVDGEDGIEKFYDNEIDIIITDIRMPNLNGLEMIDKIRTFDTHVPIIVISAHNEASYFRESIRLNIDAYLIKPLELTDLQAAINKVIDSLEFLKEYNNNLNFLKQYQELTDTNSAVSKTDLNGIITYVNYEFCKLTGYKKEELIGKNHNIIRHPNTMASEYTDLWHTIKYKKETWTGILRNRRKDNSTYYANSLIKPILSTDNEIIEYISIKNDITDIISQKKQLYDFVDSSKKPLVVRIKIDGFEDVEKLYGHMITQKIENAFAQDLLRYMPEYLNFTKFYSLTDGEYAFVQDISEKSESSINNIVKELQNFQHIVNELKVDIGELDYDIAIVMSVAYGMNCLENVKYGMNSLMKSKQDFIISNNLAKKEQEKALNNLKILKMVQIAIENSKIISYFQPIVCNKTQEVVKYESLVRLVDEDEKVISPFFFLDIAKKGKYYSRITGIVLENSFAALNHTTKSITINISALDIEKASTREQIYTLLQTYKEDCTRVVFELLEDEDVKDFDEITDFIVKVKSYGVKIAIDDFGAGYSNFERLLKYQPNILKIDGCLIRNIETDSYSMSVVKTIVSFAKEQKIEMVAEFIENENIYRILKDLGVEYSQGYYFGKPDVLVK